MDTREDWGTDLRRELRKAKLERAEIERRFRNFAENIEDVFYQVGPGRDVLYVSPAYEKVFGRPVEEVYGRGLEWLDGVHPDDAERVTDARWRIDHDAPLDLEYRIVRPDGGLRWVRDRAYLVPNNGSGAVGVVRDITEERQLEEVLSHAQKMEAVGVLATSVAHDFGNLLHGIMGGTAIALSNDTSPERARAYLQRVLEACRRGSALVAQLMSFSRKRRPNPAPMYLDHYLDQVAVLLDRLLGEHIELEVVPQATNAALVADPVQIEQVLLNLAANARAAMPTGGTLTISTEALELSARGSRPAGAYVRLLVMDSGTGMDEETKQHIFDPFYTTKDAGSGTGLGLSTVLETVESLGGHVEVRTEVGWGTIFVIDFPRVEAPSVVRAPRSRPRIRFRGRALLVEDDGLVRITVRHYLEELGFETIAAETAADALEYAELFRDQIDVVVSDVALPGQSGPAFVQELRKRHANALRVLFMSAHPPGELVDQGVIDVSDPALAKPFERDALEAKLGQLLPTSLRRRPSTPSMAVLEATSYPKASTG